jgi:hypothetical protein
MTIAAKNADASFRFTPLLVDKNKDLFGVCELKVSPALIKFGQRQTLKVAGRQSGINAWFMLQKSDLPAAGQMVELRKQNQVEKKIAELGKERLLHSRTGASARICSWPDGCAAAVSIVGGNFPADKYKDASIVKLKFSEQPDGYDNPFIMAVEQAVSSKKWLIVSYPKRYFSKQESTLRKFNSTYLKQMNCLVWQAEPDKIAAYLKVRRQCRIAIEPLDKKHIRVTLTANGKLPEKLPLTVQIIMPKGAWGGVVTDAADKPVPFRYIVVDNKIGVRLNMLPGGVVTVSYNIKNR